MPEIRAAIQSDLDRLKKWDDWKLVKLNTIRSKVLHLD